MKKETYFSIILPVYNDEKNISKAIGSILNQSYKNWELIIIDDCSADKSYEIAKKFARKNKKITTFRNKKNQGAAYSMNFGTRKARYGWVGIVDSDGIEPKNWMKTANKNVKRNIDIFGGKVIYLKKDIKLDYISKVFYYFEQPLFQNTAIFYNKNNLTEPIIAGQSFFYKKEVFNKIGGFDTNIRAGYDRLFSSLAVENGFNVKYNPNLFVYHPLYDYTSLKNFFKRGILFTKWKNLAFKKSRILEKPYRKVPYLFFSLLIFILLSCLIFGLLNAFKLILGLMILFFLSYSLKLLVKDKIPLRYIPSYIIVDFIKKSISSTIYILKLKPRSLDWKDRIKNDPKK